MCMSKIVEVNSNVIVSEETHGLVGDQVIELIPFLHRRILFMLSVTNCNLARRRKNTL